MVNVNLHEARTMSDRSMIEHKQRKKKNIAKFEIKAFFYHNATKIKKNREYESRYSGSYKKTGQGHRHMVHQPISLIKKKLVYMNYF